MCLGPRTQELTLLLRNGRKSVSESRDWQFRALSNKLELCKSRTAAAAETCWTCWWSLGCSALLLSTWKAVSHLSKIKSHEKKWPGTHLFLLACLAILHRQSTFHCHGTLVLQGYFRQYVHLVSVWKYVNSHCALTWQLPSTLQSLAAWPVEEGGRGVGGYYQHLPG